MMLDETTVSCPYCAEIIPVFVDCSAGDLSYVEDCSVCCQPIILNVSVTPSGELAAVNAEQENP